MKTRWWADV